VAAESIEREILIEATAAVVWGVITEPDQINRWFSDAAEIEPRAETDGTLSWRPGGRGGTQKDLETSVAIRVVEAEPHRRFCFRWNYPDGAEPDERNSALVEFILTEEANCTRLRVIESGIDAVTHDGESRARYREDHEHGWDKHLGELLDHVATGAGGGTP
jgi:uncharacterized protein YndB with AHSA1/START domain